MRKILIVIAVLFACNLYVCFAIDDPRCCFRPCYDNEVYCEDPGDWYYVYEDIEVPEFPGCTLSVKYCWRECQSTTPHTIQIKYCSLLFLYDCQACDVVWAFLRPNGTLSERRIRMLETYIFKKITLDKFIIWYQGAPQQIKDLVECGSGYHAKYQWWKGSCGAHCYYTTIEEGITIKHLTPLDCTELYCCGIQIKYCYNSATQQVERTEERLQYPLVDCSQLPKPPLTVCPDGFDKETTYCEDSCEDD